ncbi:MAG: hypothetical protein KGL48_16370 [Sphingomonadales bacterium]|nr:hypothetical protein [Sphingomonadales bacterium]MDE2568040.1 hypothetical protein [Sphingomonadales bacterium]
MKKIALALLAGTVALGLSGCKKAEEPAAADTSASEATSAADASDMASDMAPASDAADTASDAPDHDNNPTTG